MAIKPTARPPTVVRNPADFHKAHNLNVIIPERFRAGIKKLGPRGWMYLGDFMRENKIAPTQGVAYRDQFKDLMLEADGKMIICGTAKLANEFRGEIA